MMKEEERSRERWQVSWWWFFSPGGKVPWDSGFKGDSLQLISNDLLDSTEKVLFNLTFKEVKVGGVENAFGRVEIDFTFGSSKVLLELWWRAFGTGDWSSNKAAQLDDVEERSSI